MIENALEYSMHDDDVMREAGALEIQDNTVSGNPVVRDPSSRMGMNVIMDMETDADHDILIEACKKKASKRSPADIEAICKFLKKTDRLGNVELPVLRRLTRVLEPVWYKKKEAIFSEGDPPEAFYVIVEGCADQYARNQTEDQNSNSLTEAKLSKNRFTPGFTRKRITFDANGQKSFVSSRVPGHALADVEILEQQEEMSSSLICMTSVFVLQAAAGGFKTIMSGNESETLVAHEDILRIQNLKELQGLDLNVINSFAFAFEEQCFETGDVICPLGGGEDDDASIYWILSGEAACFTDPGIFVYHQQKGCRDHFGDAQETQQHAEVGSTMPVMNMLPLSSITTGSVVGDSCLTMGMYSRHVIARSPVVAFRVKCSDIERRFPPITLKKMQDMARAKVVYEHQQCVAHLKVIAENAPHKGHLSGFVNIPIPGMGLPTGQPVCPSDSTVTQHLISRVTLDKPRDDAGPVEFSTVRKALQNRAKINAGHNLRYFRPNGFAEQTSLRTQTQEMTDSSQTFSVQAYALQTAPLPSTPQTAHEALTKADSSMTAVTLEDSITPIMMSPAEVLSRAGTTTIVVPKTYVERLWWGVDSIKKSPCTAQNRGRGGETESISMDVQSAMSTGIYSRAGSLLPPETETASMRPSTTPARSESPLYGNSTEVRRSSLRPTRRQRSLSPIRHGNSAISSGEGDTSPACSPMTFNPPSTSSTNRRTMIRDNRVRGPIGSQTSWPLTSDKNCLLSLPPIDGDSSRAHPPFSNPAQGPTAAYLHSFVTAPASPSLGASHARRKSPGLFSSEAVTSSCSATAASSSDKNLLTTGRRNPSFGGISVSEIRNLASSAVSPQRKLMIALGEVSKAPRKGSGFLSCSVQTQLHSHDLLPGLASEPSCQTWQWPVPERPRLLIKNRW